MNKEINKVLLITPFTSKHHTTHTDELLNGIKKKFNASINIKICAVVTDDISYDNSREVHYVLNPSKRHELFDLAEHIARDEQFTSVIIQHDFNWCGGDKGENLLFLLYSVNKPVMLILNHIPENIDYKCKQLLKNISSAATIIIVANRINQCFLEKELDVSPKKIKLINGELSFDKNALGITTDNAASISSDYIVLAYAKLLQKISANKNLHYTVPELTMEQLRESDFNKFYSEETLLSKSFFHFSSVICAIVQYYRLTEKIHSLRLLEINLVHLSHCIHQSTEDFKNQKTISPKAEHDLAFAFSIMGELLFIKSKDTIPEKLFLIVEKDYRKILNLLPQFKNLPALAVSIKGLYSYNCSIPDNQIKELIIQIADKLIVKYYRDAQIEEEKIWTEKFYHKASSKLSEALLYAFMASGKQIYKVLAIITFDWLIANLFRNGYFGAVSNTETDTSKSFYGSKSVEVTEVIITLQLFYEQFHDEIYQKYLKTAFNWFTGYNSINTSIYYDDQNICFDGIAGNQLIPSQSDLSATNYLIARILLEINSSSSRKKENIREKRAKSILININR